MIVSALIAFLVTSDLVEVVEGDLPIVITAPHGGTLAISGSDPRKDTSLPMFVTVLDTRTDALARATAKEVEATLKKKPWVVIAKFSRKYADANRPAKYGTESDSARAVYEEYHAAVRKAVDSVRTKFGKGIMVDIHGQGADKDVVFRGTQNLKTLTGASDESIYGPKSFLWILEKSGVKVVPDIEHVREKENPKFDGGFTVQTYGLGHENGIYAVQLEFGGTYRTEKAIPNTAKKLAEALKSHSNSFLSR